MLATPFSNSTATTGRAESLRFARTDMPAAVLAWASAAAAAMAECEVDLAEALVVVEDLAGAVEASAAVSAAEVASVAAQAVPALSPLPAPSLLTPSLTSLLPVLNAVRPSMSAT